MEVPAGRTAQQENSEHCFTANPVLSSAYKYILKSEFILNISSASTRSDSALGIPGTRRGCSLLFYDDSGFYTAKVLEF